jgi:formylglycine-generating enzyme required for sulfatase activity
MKKPTVWGLHDMHGNAMEWCSDAYAGFGTNEPVKDPGREKSSVVGRVIMRAFPELSTRVWKGGTYDWEDGCHCAYRSYGGPSDRMEFVGFRIAREEL